MSKTYLMGMAAQGLGWLVGIVSVLGAGPGTAAAVEENVIRDAPAAEASRPPVVLGLMADAGVPDGATGSLVLRPAEWLRVHAGGGTNSVSAGYRGGLTLMPFGAGPSVSFEAGHYRDGDANGLVRGFVGANHKVASLFSRFNYTYYNAQLGLELGRGPVQFFIHGGISYMRATLTGAAATLTKMQSASADPTTVVLGADPLVKVWAPSVKLGLVVYLGEAR